MLQGWCSRPFAGWALTPLLLAPPQAFIPDTGKGIQGATSHCLGQNFSKMFNIEFESEEKTKEHVWQVRVLQASAYASTPPPMGLNARGALVPLSGVQAAKARKAPCRPPALHPCAARAVRARVVLTVGGLMAAHGVGVQGLALHCSKVEIGVVGARACSQACAPRLASHRAEGWRPPPQACAPRLASHRAEGWRPLCRHLLRTPGA